MAGPIRISILANASQAKRELSGVADTTDSLGKKFAKFGKVAAAGLVVAGAAAAKFGVDSVKAATDLNETVSKTETVFGKQSASMLAWGKTAATSFGISNQAALEGASTFGNFFDQIGIGQKQSAEMSKTWVEMAADLGSFHNAAPTEVMDALASATRGEYDALQKFIPTINAAAVEQKALAMTGKDSAEELTNAEKAAATYQLTLKGQGKAAGDFARTSGSMANQQKILTAQFENLQASVGKMLLPIVTKFATVLNSKVIPAIQKFVDQFKSGEGAGGAFRSGLEKALAIVKTLATTLNEHKTLVLSVVAAYAAWRAISAIINVVRVATMAYTAVTYGAAGATYAQGAALTIYNAVMKAAAIGAKAWAAAQWLLNAALTANPIGLIVAAIALLVGGLVLAYKKSETFRNIVNSAFSAVKSAVTTAVSFVVNFVKNNWQKLVVILTGPIGIAAALIIKNWDKIKSATSTAVNFVKSVVTSVWNAVKAVTSSVWNGIKAVVSAVVNGIKALVSAQFNAAKTIIQTAWHAAKSITTSAWNGIKTAVSNAISGLLGLVRGIPGKITSALGNFGSLLYNAGSQLIQGLINGIASKIGAIKSKMSEVASAVKGFLPGSPVKEGPLKSWNNGGAGKRLMGLLASGITDGSAGVKRATEKVAKQVDKILNQKYDGAQLKKRSKAVDKALKDEYAALAKNGKAQDKNTERLKAARAALSDLLKQQKEYAANIRAGVIAFGNITGLGKNEDGSVSVQSLIDQLKAKTVAAQRYAVLIAQLTAQGLNKTSIQQLIDAGVEGGLATAEALAAGGKTAIAEVNKLTANLTTTGTQLGNAVASTMYDAGVQAAKGLVKGLEKEAKNLDKTAIRLANALVKAVKKALGIKSPSKVFRGIGENVTDGLVIGLDEFRVKKAGEAMATSLTSGFGAATLEANTSTSSQQKIAVTLTAEQVSALQRGREIQMDLDAYRAVGGRQKAS